MSRRTRLFNVKHDVYRVRDSHGALLYVGCSVDAFRRVPQHKYEYQSWFPLAVTVDIDQYCDRKTARYVEALAIEHEAPMWNRARESMALTRGAGLTLEVLDAFRGIPISEFWVGEK